VTARYPVPDVAIVGGGIIGAAAAAFLAADGVRVTLYERSEIAAAASGRNSGVIQHPFDPVLVALYRESLAHYRELATASAGDFRLGDEPTGLLMIGPVEAATAAAKIADAWADTYPAVRPEIVTGQSLRDLEPALAPDLVACRLAIGFPVAPGSATRAYARLAEARGATIRLGADVALALDGDTAVGVLVDGRLEPCGAVLVAAGPWTPALLDPTGGWQPIQPIWGVVAQLDLPDAPRHVVEEFEIDIEPTSEAREHAELDDGLGFSLVTADGASTLGSTFLEEQPQPDAFAAGLRERGSRYVPAIATAPLVGLRACARPVALDGRPLVGAVPGINGAFVAAGNGPWGISTGPATARLIADVIVGRDVPMPAALDPARFGRITPAIVGQRDPLPR
jgi:glycine/D-amino acid oxidase-like deaminating enzyme